MAAEDIGAEVLGWAIEALRQQCFTEDYGAAVFVLPAPAQAGGGVVMQPLWNLLLTGKSPIIGEGQIYRTVPVAFVRPSQAEVEKAVSDGLRELRDYARSKLAIGNGKPPAPAVPG